jgi:rhodanese-related sulfurtransferase
MSAGDGTTASTGATAIEVEPDRVAGWLQEDPGPQLIDVREDYEREAGHIAGSRHIALGALPSEAVSLERERPVVLYCRVGARSDMAAQALRSAGFDAYSMSGGLMRWAREGRQLVPDGGTVADH